MLLDFYASQVQYAHHLRPIYDALPEEARGTFSRAIPPNPNLIPADRIAVVSAIGDYKAIARRRAVTTVNGHRTEYRSQGPTVLVEHGVGYSFHGDPAPRRNGSYAGGIDREHVSLLPAVNRYVAEHNRAAYPGIPSPIVGCPKLDALVRLPAPRNERPKVCVSFHWDCRVVPETRWAFSWFGPALLDLRSHPEFELVMHAHPRVSRSSKAWAKAAGVPYLDTFDQVFAECDVYVNDSSSTLYEFAALGRPVVVMNAPWYRRDVHHGLRFWEHADVGLNADQPGDLLPAILDTLHSDPAAPARAAAIAEVYPYLGESCPRAVAALLDLATTLET